MANLVQLKGTKNCNLTPEMEEVFINVGKISSLKHIIPL